MAESLMQHHITVLKKEAVEALTVKPESIVVDATLGAGGHAREILSRLDERGVFVGVDADASALEGFHYEGKATVHLCHANYRGINKILDELKIPKVDGIIADLGWRMEQFSGSGKGFSFQIDEPLLMTYGDPKDYPFTAADIVNEWEEKDIRNVIKGYGEERFAGRIARSITEAREEKRILTSEELAHIVTHAVPSFAKRGKIHPATKTFQALRIAVNDELEALEEFIRHSVEYLRPNGRLAIITFHSLEDRIAKHMLRGYAHDHIGTVITKRPITATEDERKENPRARSAKLRIFEKT